MSKPKHNYSQYSSNKNTKTVDTTRDAVPVYSDDTAVKPVVETPKPAVNYLEPMVETVETVSLPKTVEGVVANCAKLNVRTEPSITADVICVLDMMSEMEIDIEKSTNEWFHVCTATGIEGYCMRRFVDARL